MGVMKRKRVILTFITICVLKSCCTTIYKVLWKCLWHFKKFNFAMRPPKMFPIKCNSCTGNPYGNEFQPSQYEATTLKVTDHIWFKMLSTGWSYRTETWKWRGGSKWRLSWAIFATMYPAWQTWLHCVRLWVWGYQLNLSKFTILL